MMGTKTQYPCSNPGRNSGVTNTAGTLVPMDVSFYKSNNATLYSLSGGIETICDRSQVMSLVPGRTSAM